MKEIIKQKFFCSQINKTVIIKKVYNIIDDIETPIFDHFNCSESSSCGVLKGSNGIFSFDKSFCPFTKI